MREFEFVMFFFFALLGHRRLKRKTLHCRKVFISPLLFFPSFQLSAFYRFREKNINLLFQNNDRETRTTFKRNENFSSRPKKKKTPG